MILYCNSSNAIYLHYNLFANLVKNVFVYKEIVKATDTKVINFFYVSKGCDIFLRNNMWSCINRVWWSAYVPWVLAFWTKTGTKKTEDATLLLHK